MNKLFLYITVFFFISCNNTPSISCSNVKLTEYSFLNDSIHLKLPSDWNLIDSTFFYNRAVVLNKVIMKNDSSSFAIVSINNYSVYKNFNSSQEDFFLFIKSKMNQLNYGKDSLIEDLTKNVNGYKVNFLRYLYNKGKNKVYDSHIGFILIGGKQVEIQLKLTESKKEDTNNIIDCILTSLQIK